MNINLSKSPLITVISLFIVHLANPHTIVVVIILIWVKFEYQGHRVKVKVMEAKIQNFNVRVGIVTNCSK